MVRLKPPRELSAWLTCTVDQRPGKNILPVAAKACWYGVRAGGKMDQAKPEHVSENYGKTVSWDTSFVEELKSGLIACRAL